jgi:hypothetical protein
MNAGKANLINVVALIVLGAWGAYATQLASMTALIPVIGGIILLICQKGVTSENKMVAHIAVVVTLLLVIGLLRPLSSALADNDSMALVRLGIMVLTGIVAMVYFIKSFIDARKARESAE